MVLDGRGGAAVLEEDGIESQLHRIPDRVIDRHVGRYAGGNHGLDVACYEHAIQIAAVKGTDAAVLEDEIARLCRELFNYFGAPRSAYKPVLLCDRVEQRVVAQKIRTAFA